MTVENEDDLVVLRRVGGVVARVRDAMLAAVTPGVSTAELDTLGAELLRRAGARPAPALAYGFPGATCISVNDAIAHGIPSPRIVLRGAIS
jgi:methionyl aminopeptidase